MCMVSINVDETALREIRPELNSSAAIRLWVQNLVEFRLQEMRAEDAEMMDLETMRENLHQMVREVYTMP